jgi:putative FmdB family regulatory protein
MPIYEISCESCGFSGEVIQLDRGAGVICPACGGHETRKLMSATSSMTGKTGSGLPGPGDTGCCGQTPGHSGCAGPGSCCGKAF